MPGKEDLDHLEQTLTSQFTDELGKLEKLRKASAARQRLEADEKATKHQNLLEQIVLMQATKDAKDDERRKWLTRYVVGPAVLALLGGGGATGYFKAVAPPETKPADVQHTVEEAQITVEKTDERVEQIESRLNNNDKKIERTVEILLDQQVEGSDGHDQLVDMIGKAHPATKRIEEPDSVKKGREKATAIKKKRKTDYDPADPLGDL